MVRFKKDFMHPSWADRWFAIIGNDDFCNVVDIQLVPVGSTEAQARAYFKLFDAGEVA